MALELNGTTGVSLVQDGVVTAADLASTLDLSGKTVTLPAGVGGKFVSYAILWDEKSSGTNGGTFSSGTSVTRDLNQEVDPDGIVTLASNQFTLGAGSYFIKWSAPAYDVGSHACRLRNVTDSTNSFGGIEYNSDTYNVGTRCVGSVRLTITASKTFELQHECDITKITNGLGVLAGFMPSIYSIVEIYKEA